MEKKLIKKGYNKCPEWLKEAYRRAVMNTCQECGKSEDKIGKLEIHRLIRGSFYIPQNIKVVCSSCHALYHANEYTGVKSK